MIYIFWTCPNIAEAKTIIHSLLDKRLIACASILPEVQSIYRWEGKIEESIETKVMLKTESRHFDAICRYIEANCSYEVPEIAQVNIIQSSSRYLSWVEQETS